MLIEMAQTLIDLDTSMMLFNILKEKWKVPLFYESYPEWLEDHDHAAAV